MILQALYELYQRKVNDGSGDLAEEGWEWKEIPFILIINREGRLVEIEDTYTDARKKRSQAFRLPQGVKKTSGVAANLLWDSPAYILGYKPDMKPERLQETQLAFRKRITDAFSDSPSDEGMAAVLAFLDNNPLEQAQAHSKWSEIAEIMPFMTFRLDGDFGHPTVCERPAVAQALAARETEHGNEGQCLITGEKQILARLHPPIKGVAGTQSTGGNIISFNLEAFASYGKSQGDNAPVSTLAADAYTKALNWLLRKDSRQKLQLGDTTVVFWAQKHHPIENVMSLWFADTAKDDPSARKEAVQSLYGSPWKGAQADYSEATPFYILGLSPNAARISIRFWLETTVKEAAKNIERYFEEIELATREAEPPPALRRLLSSLCVLGKMENLPPLLEGAVMKSILQGTPYPRALLQLAILRAKAEQSVSPSRAAIFKAYLIRNCKENHTMSLDENNTNTAYLLGRLFAALEKTQEEGNPGINATICDRYYGAASSRPASTFPLLLRLKNHHISKLERENRGRAVNLERLFGEIMNGFGGSFPTLLSLEDQGRFALGYYQQRQAFFAKKESTPIAEAA